MRILIEYKILSFLFVMLIKGMRTKGMSTCGESKISLCNPRVPKLLKKPQETFRLMVLFHGVF